MNKGKKYILCARVCSEKEFNRIIIDDKYKIGQAIQKFYRVLCDGFVRNELPITAFTVRPVGKQSTGKRYLPSKDETVNGVDFHYTRSLHFPFIDKLYAFFASFFWFLSPKNCKKNDSVILDPICLLQGLGCFWACKLRGIKIVAFVTDLPKAYASPENMPKAFKNLSTWMQQSADGNIFVTEQMNIVSNPKHRPYVVCEGFADQGMEKVDNTLDNKHKTKVVLYSGGLRSEYGLDMLVKGFIQANVEDSELHIYGDGKYAKDIVEYAKQDERIKFFGSRNNAEVVTEQIKATLLVNPRYTHAEYTKYSFPGKNLEYMASGTATLTTALPGMPHEYYPYVYLIKDESVTGLASCMKEILSKPIREIHEFGLGAKKWMLANKNNKKQVQMIVSFLSSL